MEPQVRCVLFDLGGVVRRFLPERRLASLSRLSGLPEDEVWARLWGGDFDRHCDLGLYNAREIHEQMEVRLECRLDGAALRRAWAAAFAPDPAMLALVENIRAAPPRVVRVALLTNNGALLRDCLAEHLPGIAGGFDHHLFSCRFGMLKTNPALYAKVAEFLETPLESLLLVDDSPSVLATARAAGLGTFPYDSPESLPALRRLMLG